MKKQTYEGKLTELLSSEQFGRQDNLNDSVVQKMEKKTKNYWPGTIGLRLHMAYMGE